MTSDPGPAPPLQAAQAPRSPSRAARETLPTPRCHSQAGATRGTGFSVPGRPAGRMGTGSSPGRSQEEDPGLDSLFAFGQEVCLEPAGRASREGYLGPQPRPPWPAWIAGRRGGMAPSVATAGNWHQTRREKLGSEGPAPCPSAGTACSAGPQARSPRTPASRPVSAERPRGAPSRQTSPHQQDSGPRGHPLSQSHVESPGSSSSRTGRLVSTRPFPGE